MITILNNPELFPSANGYLWHVVESDNSGTAGFKYVFDIYVGGNLVTRIKNFPNPVSSEGVINVAPIVRAYIENYFKPSGNSMLAYSGDDMRVDYELKVGEEISGTVTTNLATVTGSAYNYCEPLFADVLAINNNTPLSISDYYNNLLIYNFQDNWLTERNIEDIGIEYGDNFYVSYFKKALVVIQ